MSIIELQDKLEALTDASSLRAVLYALSQMCAEKAEHIRHTWQDNVTAQPWSRIAQRLDRVAFEATKENI
jgi:hypothetical protein